MNSIEIKFTVQAISRKDNYCPLFARVTEFKYLILQV